MLSCYQTETKTSRSQVPYVEDMEINKQRCSRTDVQSYSPVVSVISSLQTVYKEGWRDSTSCNCTKIKRKYPRYEHHHLALVTLFGTSLGSSDWGVEPQY